MVRMTERKSARGKEIQIPTLPNRAESNNTKGMSSKN